MEGKQAWEGKLRTHVVVCGSCCSAVVPAALELARASYLEEACGDTLDGLCPLLHGLWWSGNGEGWLRGGWGGLANPLAWPLLEASGDTPESCSGRWYSHPSKWAAEGPHHRANAGAGAGRKGLTMSEGRDGGHASAHASVLPLHPPLQPHLLGPLQLYATACTTWPCSGAVLQAQRYRARIRALACTRALARTRAPARVS